MKLRTVKKNLINCTVLAFLLCSSCSFFEETGQSEKPEQSFEASQDLFSVLDPLLGYAHNINYRKGTQPQDKFVGFDHPDLKKLENGFSLMEHQNPGEKPIVIVALGTSTTDPYLFNGNWTFQLHLILKEKNRSHKIFNGAVSGYNSSQNLIKLQRDVFNLDEKIDVVVYLGPNDSAILGDSKQDHPAIHPYIEGIFRDLPNKQAPILTIPKYKDDIFLLSALKDYLRLGNNKIQLGPSVTDVNLHSLNTIAYMDATCRFHNTKFFHFLDPFTEDEAEIEETVLSTGRNLEVEKLITEYLKSIRPIFLNSKFSYDPQDRPKNTKIFYDFVHKNEVGNKWLAQKIEAVIFSP